MAFSPTVVITASSPFNNPGFPTSLALGTITMGASDTYVTGGITIYPRLSPSQQSGTALNFPNQINQLIMLANGAQTWIPSVVINSNGTATLKFVQSNYDNFAAGTATVLVTGGGNVAANATVATIGPALVSLSNFGSLTPANVNLSDNASVSSGTGTWSSQSVAKLNWISAGCVEVHISSGAPTGGGNFIYDIPSTGQGAAAEIPNGTSIANAVLNFIAIGA